MNEKYKPPLPASDEVRAYTDKRSLPPGEKVKEKETEPQLATHDLVSLVEGSSGLELQTTTYELKDMDEREDDGKSIRSFIGVSAAGRLALVNVIRKADGLQMWATAPVEQYKDLFLHPSQYVSPGEASLMWPSKSLPENTGDGWQEAA